MYQAEIRGKLSKRNEDREDILTSNVFSFFKYADREVFLYNLLRSWGLEITREEALRAEFQHWPQFDDRTEPDLVIVVGDYYLLIEAKYLSGFGQETEISKHQLAREAEGGAYEAKNLGKKFRLLAVTADYYAGSAFWNEIPPDILPVFQWTNWQQIALEIYQALEGGGELAIETRVFAEDLYELLLRKNLRSYAGVRVLSVSPQLRIHTGELFFEAITASYRGSFLGFLQSLDLGKTITLSPKTVFFHRRGSVSLFTTLHKTTGAIEAQRGRIFLEVAE